MDHPLKASYSAGLAAGIAGLLVFLIIHHLWIQPIWFILPVGIVIAAVGGLAVGWAYGELLPRLPARPWTVLALNALIWLILLPALILAEVRPPVFSLADGQAVLRMSIGRVALIFMLELLLTATLTGALSGWLVGGTRRAAGAMAVAGFIFALGPGHNIPLIGGTPGVGKELGLMAASIAVSALVLVELQSRLARREDANDPNFIH